MATSKKPATKPKRGALVDLNVAGALDDIFKVRDGIIEDSNSFWADLEILDDNPWQPRGLITDFDAVQMKDDLDENGQLQGALARVHPDDPKRYQLCDGHTRKEGVKRGGNAGSQMENPEQYRNKLFITVRPLTDLQMLKRAISANETRNDLNAIDLANSYVQLRQLTTNELKAQGVKLLGEPDANGNPQASWKQAADYNGKPHRHMHRIARLLELDKEVQKAIASGEIGERHGRALLELVVDKKDAKDEAQIERYKKAQRQVLGAIRRHKLTAEGAGPVVSTVKNMLWQRDKTLLDEDIEAAFQQIAEEKRKQAQETNRAKLQQGTSHLSAVPAAGTSNQSTPPADNGITVSRSSIKSEPKAEAKPDPLKTLQEASEMLATAARDLARLKLTPDYRRELEQALSANERPLMKIRSKVVNDE